MKDFISKSRNQKVEKSKFLRSFEFLFSKKKSLANESAGALDNFLNACVLYNAMSSLSFRRLKKVRADKKVSNNT